MREPDISVIKHLSLCFCFPQPAKGLGSFMRRPLAAVKGAAQYVCMYGAVAQPLSFSRNMLGTCCGWRQCEQL